MTTTPIIESEGDKLLARLLLCVEDFASALDNAEKNEGVKFRHQTQIDQFFKAVSELDQATDTARRHLYRQL